MVLIRGVKYACERCIRGHRVTTCTHTDQPLMMIKPKGRPATQCQHCREARKTKNLHTNCNCGKVNGKHTAACVCTKTSHCTCVPKKKKASSIKDGSSSDQEGIKLEVGERSMNSSSSDLSSISKSNSVSNFRHIGTEYLNDAKPVTSTTRTRVGEVIIPIDEISTGASSSELSNNYIFNDIPLPFDEGPGLLDLFSSKDVSSSSEQPIMNISTMDSKQYAPDKISPIEEDSIGGIFPLFPLVDPGNESSPEVGEKSQFTIDSQLTEFENLSDNNAQSNDASSVKSYQSLQYENIPPMQFNGSGIHPHSNPLAGHVVRSSSVNSNSNSNPHLAHYFHNNHPHHGLHSHHGYHSSPAPKRTDSFVSVGSSAASTNGGNLSPTARPNLMTSHSNDSLTSFQSTANNQNPKKLNSPSVISLSNPYPLNPTPDSKGSSNNSNNFINSINDVESDGISYSQWDSIGNIPVSSTLFADNIFGERDDSDDFIVRENVPIESGMMENDNTNSSSINGYSGRDNLGGIGDLYSNANGSSVRVNSSVENFNTIANEFVKSATVNNAEINGNTTEFNPDDAVVNNNVYDSDWDYLKDQDMNMNLDNFLELQENFKDEGIFKI